MHAREHATLTMSTAQLGRSHEGLPPLPSLSFSFQITSACVSLTLTKPNTCYVTHIDDMAIPCQGSSESQMSDNHNREQTPFKKCSFSTFHVEGDDIWFCSCTAPNHRIQLGFSHIGSPETLQGVCIIIRLVQLATVDYGHRFCLQCQAEPTAHSALSMLLERRPMRGGCARVQLNHC